MQSCMNSTKLANIYGYCEPETFVGGDSICNVINQIIGTIDICKSPFLSSCM